METILAGGVIPFLAGHQRKANCHLGIQLADSPARDHCHGNCTGEQTGACKRERYVHGQQSGVARRLRGHSPGSAADAPHESEQPRHVTSTPFLPAEKGSASNVSHLGWRRKRRRKPGVEGLREGPRRQRQGRSSRCKTGPAQVHQT